MAISDSGNVCRKCCASCDKPDCSRRCKNSPDKCGCLEKKTVLTPEEKKRKQKEYAKRYYQQKRAADVEAYNAYYRNYYRTKIERELRGKKGEENGT